MKSKIVIAGASGITGRALINHLETLDSWEVITLARSPLGFDTKAKHLSIDLLDTNLSKDKEEFKDVTHIVYAAYYPGANHFDEVAPNFSMLKNLIDLAASKTLKRIVLIEGPKYYGVHLGTYKTPAKETDPRHIPPNFYYNQEDYLREISKNADWSWSVLRPSLTAGFAAKSPMNILNVIAIYAVISKELKLPLRFPGSHKTYDRIWETTDANLLAKAIMWAAAAKEAKNAAFNVTNGDFFRWNQLWPKFAAFFEMEYKEPSPINLSEYMSDKNALWNQMIKKYSLKPTQYDQIAKWGYGDAAFNFDYDVMSDTTKVHQAGFHEFVESGEMFLRLFSEMKKNAFIP